MLPEKIQIYLNKSCLSFGQLQLIHKNVGTFKNGIEIMGHLDTKFERMSLNFHFVLPTLGRYTSMKNRPFDQKFKQIPLNAIPRSKVNQS